MKNTIALLLIGLLLVSGVSADAGHPAHDSFEVAEALVNAEIPCDDLNEDQLEALGDYYMEQIHPGEAHDRMDEMMGGEDSKSLRLMHIKMGRAFYCGDDTVFSGSGTRMGMMGTNHMFGGGMFGSFGMGLVWLFYIALGAFVFGIVFWWTYKLMIKDKKKK